MKPFKVYINEMFDNPEEFARKEFTTKVRYTFRTSAGKYNVFFDKEGAREYQFYFEDEDGSFLITDVGHAVAVKVFSTVAAILKDFMEFRSPKSFWFDADKIEGEARSSLYDKFAKMIAKETGANLKRKELSNRVIYSFKMP